MPSPAFGYPCASSTKLDYLFSSLDNFKIGLAVLNREFRFLAVNQSLAEINGIPRSAHCGLPLHKAVGSLLTEVGGPLEHVFRTGQPLPNVWISGQLPKRQTPSQWVDSFFPLGGLRGKVMEAGILVVESKLNSAFKGGTDRMRIAMGQTRGAHIPPSDMMRRPYDHQTDVNLTSRERDVLRLLASGKSNKEISSILAISVKTVETYRSRLMMKLQLPSIVHLVHYAIGHKIADLHI